MIDQLTGGQRQELINLIENESGGLGGSEYAAYKDNYRAYESYDQAVAEDPTHATAHREGTD